MGEPFGAGFCAAGLGGGVISLGGGRVRLPLPALAPPSMRGFAAPIGLGFPVNHVKRESVDRKSKAR